MSRKEVPDANAGRVFTLYTCRGQDDEAIYVGITATRARRFFQHSRMKEWWPDVVRIELEHFATLRACETAEIRAIRRLRPRANADFNNYDEKVAIIFKRCSQCGTHFPWEEMRRRVRVQCRDCYAEWLETPAGIKWGTGNRSQTGSTREAEPA
jgi:predicted Zn-ribbon and HTH transcriptional regulator